ncbi:MAG: serine/threonine-protein kinase [Acidobacteriota bacterium]|nr:serine/threonine-protein kinase [Acidobacteriota bacterium]
MTIATNTKLGRYEIVSLIGAGGMGEVYLAEDTRLRRKVALKILPENIAQDSDRLRRFEQEAFAASALNHPNILTIYEIGETDSSHFIATEFIEGETLREKMKREKIPMLEAVRIAGQIADALKAAHSSNIVHRDIKPENIMLRTDGYVKVLDFGLAKLAASATVKTEDATLQMVNTQPGMILGSVRYMSPEQARGRAVDERTDIWSLGVCLYEMLTARPPFEGETMSDALAAVIHKEAEPLSKFIPDAPAELQRIIRKALQKNADERYQTVKDLAIDLRSLRREIERGGEMAENKTEILSPHTTGAAAHETTQPETTAQTSVQTSSAEYIVNQVKSHKWQTVFAALGIIALLVSAWAAYRWFAGAEKTKSSVPFQNLQVSILPNSAKMFYATISPDGNYIAFISESEGKYGLSVRQLATGSTADIIPPSSQRLRSPYYSPDGNYIYYVQHSEHDLRGTLYRTPALAGAPRKIAENIDGSISFAPDGKRFAFGHYNPKDEIATLFIANADGTNLQPLIEEKQIDNFFAGDPAWSPDGKKIIVPVSKKLREEAHEVRFLEISTADGSHKPFGALKFREISDNFWLKDGSGLLFTGFETDQAFLQIWHIAYPSGELRRVTNDVNVYDDFSISADNKLIVAYKSEFLCGLQRYNPATKETAQIMLETRDVFGRFGVSETPDGKLVFTKLREGTLTDIWISDANGKNAQQLTSDSRWNGFLQVTPDGRFIIFQSDRTGVTKIWRMEINGNNPTLLTSAEGYTDYTPRVTPDGKSVIFIRESVGSDKRLMMKVSIEGGEAAPLTSDDDSQFIWRPEPSPDGKRLAYLVFYPETNKTFLKIAPFDGANLGKPEKEFDWEKNYDFIWSPDGKSLTYHMAKDGKANLWQLPLDGSSPKQLTFFTSNFLGGFAWSRDGKQLFVTPGNSRSDLVLIKDAMQAGAN